MHCHHRLHAGTGWAQHSLLSTCTMPTNTALLPLVNGTRNAYLANSYQRIPSHATYEATTASFVQARAPERTLYGKNPLHNLATSSTPQSLASLKPHFIVTNIKMSSELLNIFFTRVPGSWHAKPIQCQNRSLHATAPNHTPPPFPTALPLADEPSDHRSLPSPLHVAAIAILIAPSYPLLLLHHVPNAPIHVQIRTTLPKCLMLSLSFNSCTFTARIFGLNIAMLVVSPTALQLQVSRMLRSKRASTRRYISMHFSTLRAQ